MDAEEKKRQKEFNSTVVTDENKRAGIFKGQIKTTWQEGAIKIQGSTKQSVKIKLIKKQLDTRSLNP